MDVTEEQISVAGVRLPLCPDSGRGPAATIPIVLLKARSPAMAVGSRRASDLLYDLFIVKLPVPLQFPPPTSVQLPVTVFPLTSPVRVNTLPLGVPDFTINPNLPVTLPLKFPPRAKVPVSVSPETKHEFDEKLNLVMVSVPSLFVISEVVKLKFCDPVRVAVQFPFMLAGLLDPQPTSAKPAISNSATANFFIVGTSFGFFSIRCHPRNRHLHRCGFFDWRRKVKRVEHEPKPWDVQILGHQQDTTTSNFDLRI